jgi:predicted DCC family thiol-disulfide oxidoreductase YuxK
MEKLYVLYDPHCELCCRLKNWLLVQRTWIGLAPIAQGSEKAKRLFPELEGIAGKEDLVVISDDGAVYMNDRAWIMVLYALIEYRDWAARLTHPLLMPLARQAFAALSKNRHLISDWLGTNDPVRIAVELRKVELSPCTIPAQDESPTLRDYLR